MGKLGKGLAYGLILAVVVVIATIQIRHWKMFGHLAPPALHSDVEVFPWDIAIPGITKGYQARITNFGLFPRRVDRCDFLTDAFEHGESVGYKIEMWNKRSNTWETMQDASSVYCQPAPLSMVKADRYTKWLWPGQSLSTGTEATGARGTLKGKSLRFVVIANGKDYPTASFVVDEQIQDAGAPYRVTH